MHEGLTGYWETDGGDIGRRMEGLLGEGWRDECRGHWEKVGGNIGRRMEDILGDGWRGYWEKDGVID